MGRRKFQFDGIEIIRSAQVCGPERVPSQKTWSRGQSPRKFLSDDEKIIQDTCAGRSLYNGKSKAKNPGPVNNSEISTTFTITWRIYFSLEMEVVFLLSQKSNFKIISATITAI